MRKLTQVLVLVWIHSMALAADKLPVCGTLRVQGNKLWSSCDSDEHLLVSDPRGIEMPRRSPDGARIAYVRPTEGGATRFEVVVFNMQDRSGRVLARLTREDSAKSMVDLGWHGDDFVWVEGHVNPSTNLYYEWNVETGGLVSEIPGYGFTWSPDGRRLAHVEHRIHFGPDAVRPAGLEIDGEVIWTPREGERIRAPIAWSADSRRIAFTTKRDAETVLKVVDVGLRRETASVPLGTHPQAPGLRWTDSTHVAVEGRGATRVIDAGSRMQ